MGTGKEVLRSIRYLCGKYKFSDFKDHVNHSKKIKIMGHWDLVDSRTKWPMGI